MDPKIIMGKQVKEHVAGATGKSWKVQAEGIIIYKFLDMEVEKPSRVCSNIYFPHGWATWLA